MPPRRPPRCAPPLRQRVGSVDLDEPAVVVEDRHGSHRLTCRRALGLRRRALRRRVALEARGTRAEARTLDLAYQEIDVPAGGWTRPSRTTGPPGRRCSPRTPCRRGSYRAPCSCASTALPSSYAAARGGQDLYETFVAHFPELPGSSRHRGTARHQGRRPSRPSAATDGSGETPSRRPGDSCHAMAPFMGHERTAGSEDDPVLVDRPHAAADRAAGLAAYEKSRIEDADAISRELSYRHYFTMAGPPREETAAEVLRGRAGRAVPRPGSFRCTSGAPSPRRATPPYCVTTSVCGPAPADPCRPGTAPSWARRPTHRLRACIPSPTPTTATPEDSVCS